MDLDYGEYMFDEATAKKLSSSTFGHIPAGVIETVETLLLIIKNILTIVNDDKYSSNNTIGYKIFYKIIINKYAKGEFEKFIGDLVIREYEKVDIDTQSGCNFEIINNIINVILDMGSELIISS